MKAVRLPPPSGAVLFPFDEAPSRLPLLDVPLRHFQDRELYRAGLEKAQDARPGEPLPAGTRVVFSADAVFTADTVRALVEESRERVRRAAVKRGTALFDFVQPLQEGTSPDEDLPVPLWAGPLDDVAADERAPALAEAPLAVVCDEDGAVLHRVPPAGAPPHVLRVPRCTRIAGRLAHWLHLLNLNHAVLVAERERAGATGGRNVLEGEAHLHPNAVVEDSLLAPGVVVEHGATVLRSFLGEGVRVADHAVLADCVIGPGCHTLVDTHMRRVVALGGSTLSNLGTEDLLLGREVFITTGVAFFGYQPGTTVVVDGHDTRRPVLGGCVGNRVTLGARSLFAAGMAVPSGAVIVGRPDEALQKLDERGLARASVQLGDPTRDA